MQINTNNDMAPPTFEAIFKNQSMNLEYYGIDILCISMHDRMNKALTEKRWHFFKKY